MRDIPLFNLFDVEKLMGVYVFFGVPNLVSLSFSILRVCLRIGKSRLLQTSYGITLHLYMITSYNSYGIVSTSIASIDSLWFMVAV